MRGIGSGRWTPWGPSQGPFSQPRCLPMAPGLTWRVPLRSAGGTTTRPLGGECLGLTQMGNESPGQPLHWPQPPLTPPPPSRALGGTPPGSKGVAQRPSGPLWASAGPAPFFDLPVHQLGNSGCSSVRERAPVSSRGSQQQRHTQEAASLALSSLDLRGTGSLRSFLAPSIETAPFHTFSFWCPLPPGSGLPLAPQGPGPVSVPFTWFCPLPSPLPAPPPVQSVESANQSPAKVGQRGGRGSRD